MAKGTADIPQICINFSKKNLRNNQKLLKWLLIRKSNNKNLLKISISHLKQAKTMSDKKTHFLKIMTLAQNYNK